MSAARPGPDAGRRRFLRLVGLAPLGARPAAALPAAAPSALGAAYADMMARLRAIPWSAPPGLGGELGEAVMGDVEHLPLIGRGALAERVVERGQHGLGLQQQALAPGMGAQQLRHQNVEHEQAAGQLHGEVVGVTARFGHDASPVWTAQASASPAGLSRRAA